MNRYKHGDREVVVNSLADTIEMPLEKGGANVKWTRSDKRVIVPVTEIPKTLTNSKPLPLSTPAVSAPTSTVVNK